MVVVGADVVGAVVTTVVVDGAGATGVTGSGPSFGITTIRAMTAAATVATAATTVHRRPPRSWLAVGIGEQASEAGLHVRGRRSIGKSVLSGAAADLVDRAHDVTSSTCSARSSERRALNSDVFTVPAETSRISAIWSTPRSSR